MYYMYHIQSKCISNFCTFHFQGRFHRDDLDKPAVFFVFFEGIYIQPTGDARFGQNFFSWVSWYTLSDDLVTT